MITGKNRVLEFVKMNNAPYWQVRRGEGSAPIMEYNPPAPNTASIDESCTRLNTLLNMIDNGTYFIECWESAGQKKGWFKDSFQINENGYGAPAGISGFQQQSNIITPDEVEKRIQDALNRDREARELEAIKKENEELKKRNKELQDESDSFMPRLMKRAEPYIGQLLEGFGFIPAQQPAAVRISGLDTEKKHEMANKVNERVEAALEKWYEKDPQCIELIEKIVELAETKPAVYEKAKGFLINPGMISMFM